MENRLEDAALVTQGETKSPTSYEAPKIESILTPEALEREVHYAGVQPVSGAQAL